MPIIQRGSSGSPKLRISTSLRGAGVVEEHSVGVEVRPEGLVERTEETLPAQVAIKRVRTTLAESLRFPEEGQSAQG